MARLDVPNTCVYTITAQGCDDHNTVHVDLTTEEALAVAKVAERINAAWTYSCEPKLFIRFDEHDRATEIEVP